VTAACAVLSFGASFAAEPISLAFYEGWGHYKVEGSFFVDADPQIAWDVLTDYAHIPEFVHSMKVSRVLERNTENLVLEQEGEGGFLFFTKRIHLLLDVHEQPTQSIVFTDSSHKDFSFYQGTWSVGPSNSGHGLEIIYTLDAQQNFSAPAFIASDIVKGNVVDLLQSLRDRIQNRQALYEARLKEKTEPVKLANQPKPAVISQIR
jgi:ribosome-associated toxin RatA of RatAB toxin-antitoxin module